MRKRVALVTGGSRGIGAAIVECLATQNIDVIAPTRAQLDLNNNESIECFFSTFDRPIDIVVNCAGINIIADIENISDSIFEDTIQINLKAPLKVIQCVSKGMKARQWGRIINISSIWSEISKEGRATYSSTKAAVNGLTRTVALELAPYGVLVNAVAPGYVNTALTRQNNSPEQIESIKQNIPTQRLAEPSEIAELVSFLVSDKNSYVTGQTIVIDGGYICR